MGVVGVWDRIEDRNSFYWEEWEGIFFFHEEKMSSFISPLSQHITPLKKPRYQHQEKRAQTSTQGPGETTKSH